MAAIIVTYHPDFEELSEVLSSALGQVSILVLVDNSVDEVYQQRVRELVSSARQSSLECNLVLVSNHGNSGLSCAYNQGVSIARSLGANFVLLLDQDSNLDGHAIWKLLLAYDELWRDRPIGSVSCRNVEVVRLTLGPLVVLERLKSSFQGHQYSRGKLLRLGSCDELTTFTNSGTLIPMTVIEKVGPFCEDLFLDAVDYDYSLRLRSHGYKCVMCQDAEVAHRLGSQFKRRLLWHEVQLRVYPSQRSYFIVRDTLRCARTWFRQFPSVVSSFVFFMAVGTLGALALLPDRSQRLGLVLRGLADSGRPLREIPIGSIVTDTMVGRPFAKP